MLSLKKTCKAFPKQMKCAASSVPCTLYNYTEMVQRVRKVEGHLHASACDRSLGSSSWHLSIVFHNFSSVNMQQSTWYQISNFISYFDKQMLVQNEVVHVLNRSRAFVVITGGNAANHSIVVGIVGERVLLSLLSYCYLFVIVMPVSVPCCRCYHVWNTLLPKDTFLSAIIKNKKAIISRKESFFATSWMTHKWNNFL